MNQNEDKNEKEREEDANDQHKDVRKNNVELKDMKQK